MATTASLLSALASRWSGDYAIPNMNAKLQYVLTEPLLEDQVSAVKVMFNDDPVNPEIGEHVLPDVVLTLSGPDFERLANDELLLPVALTKRQIQVRSNSDRGRLLIKRLYESYQKRP